MAFHLIPRPKTFLYLISLRTATELIIFTLLINKVSGLYGLLALLTGYHLSAVQLSMYIYSIIIFALVCYLAPHIKRQSPLQCLALAWIYIFDSLINAAYTALFGTTWFILLARHLGDGTPAQPQGPGGKMMNDTAGFTDPETNVSRVDVVATPAAGLLAGQDAVAVGKHDASSATLGSAVFQGGSIMSITAICMLWMVRVYFCLIVMAYARGVLRQYIVTMSASSYGGSDRSDLAENPFAPGREQGEGCKGALGRAMTRVLQNYWLGKDDEDEWVRGAGDRFRRLAIKVPEPGVGERERRARSGTGPPVPLKKMEKP
ncbi:hypothetical protein AAFC00_007200 [Neodothiora populina]|uniref:DUF1753-domain-containing protein n=1 Tax=Neodothiora populina TaxID=2781224 RepID=A0ABR3PHH9_9PEZI